MLTPLAQRIFELDVAAMALVAVLGRGDRAELIRHRIREMRLAAGRVVLAELATRPAQTDPAEAVKAVVEAAIGAGLGWQSVVAIVNNCSDRRGQ